MKYRTIVADPPWAQVQRGSNRKADPRRYYPVMSLDAIRALDVGDSAEKDAHLWLWGLSQHMDWPYEVARAWGFEPITTLTWCKSQPGVGQFQTNTEHVLLCRRGSLSFGRTGGSWFKWPRGEHSKKPDAFYDLVEQVSPGPYLELFARRARLGDWNYWGNQSLGTAEIAA